MVKVFREVWRVLRDDGTLWLNMGDSYASAWACKRRNIIGEGSPDEMVERGRMGDGLKEKDLCGIPWRLAFALQADDWYLRSDIIWAKPNPMPESVTDRPTKAHEYIFLLTKSPHYFFDQEAVREPQSENTHLRYSQAVENGFRPIPAARIDSKEINRPGYKNWREGTPKSILSGGRNIRTVWNISTQSFSGAHFATFPEELVRRCLFAGTSEKGCCPKCGGPWVRVVTHEVATPGQNPGYTRDCTMRNDGDRAGSWTDNKTKTLGWRPSCSCREERTIPCVVFDPFFGSGTVGVVAQKNHRRFIGLELKPEYCQMARGRIRDANIAML